MRLLSILFPLILFSSTALADSTPDTQSRIQWIQSRLDAASGYARIWQYGWTGIHATSMVVRGSQAYSADSAAEEYDRTDAQVAGVASMLGLIGDLLGPVTTYRSADTLAAMPANTDAEATAKLKKAEQLLEDNANQERQARSTTSHITTILVALVSGLVVAHDDNRNDDGMRMFATSLISGELQIYTAPTDATQAWEAYQHGDLSDANSPAHTDGGLAFTVIPAGVAVDYRF